MRFISLFLKQKKKILISIFIISSIIFGTAFIVKNTQASISYNFITKWGTYGFGFGKFQSPADVAVDSLGNIYVSDTQNHRIQKFDSSGTYISQWGNPGNNNGEFNYPGGIAIDSSDNVYVADTQNYRIQKFDSSGNYLSQFGSVGNGNGEFGYPHGIAINSIGDIYVTDAGNSRIQKFDSSGNFILKWGSTGTGTGHFSVNNDIAIDSLDNVYVADAGNQRIQKFNSLGVYIASIGGACCLPSSVDGEFWNPNSVAIDSLDNIYVGDTNNYRIQKFDSSGAFITKWGSSGSGDGEFGNLYGLVIDGSDNIYSVDYYYNKIQKFDSSGNFIFTFGTSGYNYGEFSSPEDVATDSSGNVYVTDTNNSRIQKFDSSGTYLSQWGNPGNTWGEMNNPIGIAIDSSDSVYVMDYNNARVQKFDSSGNFLLTWGSGGSGDGQFNSAFDVTVDSLNNIYVADRDNDRIQKFDSSGNFITKWGTSGSGDGEFNHPSFIAIDSLDNIYVTDSYNHRIQKFDSSGIYISQFGTEGSGDGQFEYPLGITVDYFDNLYVADVYNRIQKLDTSGNFITKIGSTGSSDGQFNSIFGLNFDSSNNLYIVDSGNDRIQKFSVFVTPSLTTLTPSTIVSGTGNTVVDITGLDFASDSVVRFNGSPRATIYIDSTHLTTTFTTADFASAGTYPITVYNPTPSGTESNSSDFIVTPAPSGGGGSTGGSGCSGPLCSGITPPPVIVTPPPVIIPVIKTTPPPSTKHSVTYKKLEIIIPPAPVISTPQPVVKKEIPKPIIPETKTLALISTLAALSTLPFSNWRSLFSIFAIKKRKSWGTVYDSITKQPLDPAYVVLQDLQGNEVATSITDLDGRFGFLVKPGTYKIIANKTNYTFPSTKLGGSVQDELYTDLYFGEEITIQKKGDVIIKNIPMDPTNFDWNEFAKKQQNLLKFSSKKDLIIKRITDVIFWSGFSVSIIASYLVPKTSNLSIVALYIILFALRNTILKPTPQGTVTEKETGKPLSFAIIRVFSTATNTEIIHKVTDENGIYFCLIPNGSYYVKVEKKNSDGSYSLVYTSDGFEVRRGVIKTKFKI